MKKLTLTIISLIAGLSVAQANGTAGGLTLLETSGARASSLAEAFTAAQDDITAFSYNPASLGSLSRGHASFMYQSGLAEDTYGQLMLGAPFNSGSLGLSVGYYNGGDIQLFDGTAERTVNAQRDLTVNMGASRQFGLMTVGVTGKYLSSELAETAKATAFAADFGMSMPITNRIQLGASVLNLGSQLKFVEEGDDLPRMARAGMAFKFQTGGYNSTLFLDAPYNMVDQEVNPAAGLEINFGPLALRGGYKSGSDINEFSVGTGFLIGSTSLDYSFGMVEDLDSQHRISLAMRFGTEYEQSGELVKKKKENRTRTVVQIAEDKMPVVSGRRTLSQVASAGFKPSKQRRIYTVKAGDSLGKIARRYYGQPRHWKAIYQANKHILEDPRTLEVGQRIILP